MGLIGLVGYAQHGKDSVGNVLVTKMGYERFAFAEALRRSVVVLDPIVDFEPTLGPVRYSQLLEQVGYEEAKKRPEVRRLLQVMGTEVVRDIIGPNSWVNALDISRILQSDNPDHVITDVRFPNEFNYVKENRGTIVAVNRVGFDNGIAKDHPSEAHIAQLMADADLTIYNTGTLADLREEVLLTLGEVPYVHSQTTA